MKLHRLITITFATLVSVLPLAAAAAAAPITVTDIAGREVTLEKPVERIVLTEARLIYGIAAIDRENPFRTIVGWRNDLWTTDKDGFNAYATKFPKVKDIPFIGRLNKGTLQTEAVIKMNPDVVLVPIDEKTAAEEFELEQKLSKVGTKIIYLDFRQDMLKNTEASLKILGKLYGHEDRAEEVVAFWKEQLSRVIDRVKEANPERPNVFLYRIAGLIDGCCATFGPANFGQMVEWVGGHNLGSDFVPGLYGTMNPEQVAASSPDVIIATGANWSEANLNSGFVNVGPNAAPSIEESRAALNALMEAPAFQNTTAVKDGNVYAIWHMFYTSPYQFVAVQQMAKWIHPELFADLDPEATFREFHERFLPIPYQPGYWVEAKDNTKS